MFLEHFQKYCSRSAVGEMGAVFLGFGFVSAQLQGSLEPAPSPKPRQNPKILAPNGCTISSNALKPFALALLLCGWVWSAPAAAAISDFAGTGVKGFSGDNGPATGAQLNFPTGLARSPDGALYFCDTSNQRVRKIAPDGKISTIAGTGEPGWSGDGGPAMAAKLHEPYEVRFDHAGNIYWVERLSHCVRKLDAKTGRISTIAGNGSAGFSGWLILGVLVLAGSKIIWWATEHAWGEFPS